MSQEGNVKTVAVIGGGFCGMMTVIQLMERSLVPVNILLISNQAETGKGVAYSTASDAHLLNVPAAKMSCRPSEPSGFLDWIAQRKPFCDIDKDILGKMFLPRKEYGAYLQEMWENALAKKAPHIHLQQIRATAVDIESDNTKHRIRLSSGETCDADYVVLATGNDIPGNPKIRHPEFFESPAYFKSPWDARAVQEPKGNVLIVGNGLTMVDTTLELMNNGCPGTIYSLSPNGFRILPHRHNGMVYTKLVGELKEPYDVNELFRLFRRHIEFVRRFGLSAEPVVDSVRDISQGIWQRLTMEEKRRFMRHLRHLWGLARHRLPLHIYDFIKELKQKNKLVVIKGRLVDITENDGTIRVDFYNSATNADETITVSRVINCTGPLPDITRSTNELLLNLVRRGAIRPDELRLGIDVNTQGAVIRSDNSASETMYTLGGTMKGLLWESTAVPELRVQAEKLAMLLAEKLNPAAVQVKNQSARRE